MVHPPFEGFRHIFNQLSQVVIEFTVGTRRLLDRQIAERRKAVVLCSRVARGYVGNIGLHLVHRSVLVPDKGLGSRNPRIRPVLLLEVFGLHTGVQDHSDAICGGGIRQGIVAVHLLSGELHSSNDGGVVSPLVGVVERVCESVYGKNDSGNTGRVLGEEQGGVLVLLEAGVSSIG